jgi:hypothetical protein
MSFVTTFNKSIANKSRNKNNLILSNTSKIIPRSKSLKKIVFNQLNLLSSNISKNKTNKLSIRKDKIKKRINKN